MARPSFGRWDLGQRFFLNPSALPAKPATTAAATNTNTALIAPAHNPAGSGAAGGGGSGAYSQAGAQTSYSGNSAGGLISGAQGTWQGQSLMYNGSSIASIGEVNSMLGQIVQSIPSGITNAASYITAAANQSVTAKLIFTALGLLVPGVGTVMTLAKVINWMHNKFGATSPIPGVNAIKGNLLGGTGGNPSGGGGAYSGNSAGGQVNVNNGGGLGRGMFTNDYSGTQSGDSAISSGLGAPMAGELGPMNNGSGSTWDGSFTGGNAGGSSTGPLGNHSASAE